jgi:hypothetical protein
MLLLEDLTKKLKNKEKKNELLHNVEKRKKIKQLINDTKYSNLIYQNAFLDCVLEYHLLYFHLRS